MSAKTRRQQPGPLQCADSVSRDRAHAASDVEAGEPLSAHGRPGPGCGYGDAGGGGGIVGGAQMAGGEAHCGGFDESIDVAYECC
jgi:hypothetical protein